MATDTSITEIEYPESDGQPMGESDIHRDWMFRIIELLKYYYRGQQVYVTGDLLLYYEEGNPRKFVVPDAFVSKDRDPGRRRVYKLWVEGKPPDFVLETSSKSTQHVDLVHKCALYARLGVKEYFIYDPTGEYLNPQLLGYRLSGTGYIPLEPDDTGAIESEELGLILRVEEGELVMYVKATGDCLLAADEREMQARTREQVARAREEESRVREEEARAREEEAHRHAEQEAAARQVAEAEIARLREQLTRQTPGH